MKFQIEIGKSYDLDLQKNIPKRVIIINEAQRNILTKFANKQIDQDGNAVYDINGCVFTIGISFSDSMYYKESLETENLENLNVPHS